MKINRISVESALARMLPSHVIVLRDGLAMQLA